MLRQLTANKNMRRARSLLDNGCIIILYSYEGVDVVNIVLFNKLNPAISIMVAISIKKFQKINME